MIELLIPHNENGEGESFVLMEAHIPSKSLIYISSLYVSYGKSNEEHPF